MMEEEDSINEQVEVLSSIYPELTINQTENKHYKFSIKRELKPVNEISFELINIADTGIPKVLDSFKSLYVGPIEFTGFLPLIENGFEIRSSWINEAIILKINNDVKDMVNSNDYEQEELIYTVFDFFMNEMIHEYEDEIYSFFKIETVSTIQFESFKRMAQTARLDNFNNSRFICSICLENKDGRDGGVLLDCNHTFCKECLVEYFTQIINNEDSIKLQCTDCPMIIIKNTSSKTISELKRLLFTDRITTSELTSINLDEELISKYLKLLELSRFEKFKAVYPFSCSECPGCKKWIFRDNVDDKLMHCNYCKFAYCFDCNHSWHGKNNACGMKINTIPIDVIEKIANEECSEFSLKKFQTVYGKHNLRLCVDSYLADKLFYETVQEDDEMIKCPNCNTVIIKSDGCNKMKCFVCSENFCYLCGRSLTKENPYEHYNDVYSDCHNRLFEGMPGAEDEDT